MGSQRFREYNPDQDFLLPPSLREWVRPDHLASFISDVVDQLDLSEIINYYDNSRGGQAPFHPITRIASPTSASRLKEARLAAGERYLDDLYGGTAQTPDYKAIARARLARLRQGAETSSEDAASLRRARSGEPIRVNVGGLTYGTCQLHLDGCNAPPEARSRMVLIAHTGPDSTQVNVCSNCLERKLKSGEWLRDNSGDATRGY